jgi:GH35 family endo-1,4-beta-xylanase
MVENVYSLKGESDMSHPLLRCFEEQRVQTERRIEGDIQRYRKAFAKIRVVNSDGKPVENVKVRVNQRTHDFKFGCNIFMLEQFPDEEHNQAYREEFKKLFNYAIVPFYWSDFEPVDGEPRFGENPVDIYRRPAPEKVLKYCADNNIGVKGHPLFWHHFLPDWLVKDQDEAFFRVERRIREIAQVYKDRIRDWDVVNESLSRPSHQKDNRLPHDYVRRVFDLANRYFPGNRLFINETTEYSWQSHFLWEMSAYYMQIENMLMKNSKIDAVGLQYHLFRTPEVLEKEADILLNPACLFDVMDTYGKFNRPLHISEVTIPAYGLTDENKEIQAQLTEWLYKIWFSHPSMESIVWWNLVDGTAAYAPLGSAEGENYYGGGLLNYDMSKKPVYHVLDRLIHKEWHTELEFSQNEFIFNGFFGEYDVEIHLDGQKILQKIHLSKEGNREFTLKV